MAREKRPSDDPKVWFSSNWLREVPPVDLMYSVFALAGLELAVIVILCILIGQGVR